MKVLVVGGSGSGKSAFAEDLACALSPTRTYVATMRAWGTEARARIRKHRQQRAGKGFTLIECSDSLGPATRSANTHRGVVLLDDLGNLVSNALFDENGHMHNPGRILRRLEHEVPELAHHYEHTVIVGNETGSEGTYAHETTLAWVRLNGALCCAIAAKFDTVVEVVAGIPCVIKGRLP